jgi:hypothetical protein
MVLQNPLAGLSIDEVQNDAEAMAQREQLFEHREAFRKGAAAAKLQNMSISVEQAPQLDSEDREILLYESKHPWKSSPPMLFLLSALCAGCAIVQGMDQTVINGAQVCYATSPLSPGAQSSGQLTVFVL